MVTLFESFLSFYKPKFNPNVDFYLWVSPDNKIVKVPQYGHISHMRKIYRDTHITKLYDKAFSENWTRVEYMAYDMKLCGNLSITSLHEKRVKDVLIKFFKDFLMEGNKDIYVNFGENWNKMGDKNFRILTNNKAKIKKAEGSAPEVAYIWDYLNE
jgi:hypothetical protein